MPAVVAASVFVDAKVVAATGWAKEFPWLAAFFKLVKVVKNRKRHAAGTEGNAHCGTSS
jgi:hypothetical protein